MSLDFVRVFKYNHNHDRFGRFSSDQNPGAKGPAATLAARPRPERSFNDVLDAALSTPEEKEEFKKAYAKSTEIFNSGEDTKHQYTRPGTKGSYTTERLKLHRKIISSLIKGKDGENEVKGVNKFKPEPGQKPTVIFLGGRGGSGKSSFNKENNPDLGVYDPKHFMVLDSDHIKSLLPGYIPEESTRFHEESSHIFDKAAAAARHAGLNVILDFTINSDKSAWLKRFQKAGYDAEGYYVHRPQDMAAESSIKRWKEGVTTTDLEGKVHTFTRGRIIPVSTKPSDKPERNFDRLIPKFKKWAVYDNPERIFHFRKVAEGGIVKKYNTNHDPKTGEFSSGGNGTVAGGVDFTENGVHIGIFDRPLQADDNSIAITDVFHNDPPSMEKRKEIIDQFAKAEKVGVESIPVKDIIPMQDTLVKKKLKSVQQDLQSIMDLGKYPAVFRDNGKAYLLDGHHRVGSEIKAGYKDIKANIYQVKGTTSKAEDLEKLEILKKYNYVLPQETGLGLATLAFKSQSLPKRPVSGTPISWNGKLTN